jgi:two-component system response regulator QseB
MHLSNNREMHLLLIEDDLDLGKALQQALHAEGFTSTWVRRVTDCPEWNSDSPFKCVLLDLTLPDGDGIDLIRKWRHEKLATPIVVITARSALETRLEALNQGADDFVIKPFATAELVARIQAVCRRSSQQAGSIWTFGDLEIEPRVHKAYIAGVPLDLSPREFRILLELAREPGSVVSKSSLASRLEPLGTPLDFTAIEVHVSNLRKKIGSARVTTVRGVGYMLAI